MDNKYNKLLAIQIPKLAHFCFNAGYTSALNDLNDGVHINAKNIDINVIIKILKQSNGSEEFLTLLTHE